MALEEKEPEQIAKLKSRIELINDPTLKEIVDDISADLISIGIAELTGKGGNSRPPRGARIVPYAMVTFGGWSADKERLELKILHRLAKKEIDSGLLVFRQQRPFTVELGRLRLVYDDDPADAVKATQDAITTWIEPLKPSS